MQPLAEPVLAEYRRGAFAIIRSAGGDVRALDGDIRDWNISRQLWWDTGFRCSPAPRASTSGPNRVDPSSVRNARGRAGSRRAGHLVLVLAVAFATFGWPRDTPDSSASIGPHAGDGAGDLFFWVARMLMSGYHFMDHRLPFATVYLHGTVRDTKHARCRSRWATDRSARRRQAVRRDALRWTLIAGSLARRRRHPRSNDWRRRLPGPHLRQLWTSASRAGQLPTRSPHRSGGPPQLTLATAGSCRARGHDPRDHRLARAIPPRWAASAPTNSCGTSWRTGTWSGEPRLGRRQRSGVLLRCALRVLHPVVPS